MQAQLEAMELGSLLGIFLQSFFVQLTIDCHDKLHAGKLD